MTESQWRTTIRCWSSLLSPISSHAAGSFIQRNWASTVLIPHPASCHKDVVSRFKDKSATVLMGSTWELSIECGARWIESRVNCDLWLVRVVCVTHLLCMPKSAGKLPCMLSGSSIVQHRISPSEAKRKTKFTWVPPVHPLWWLFWTKCVPDAWREIFKLLAAPKTLSCQSIGCFVLMTLTCHSVSVDDSSSTFARGWPCGAWRRTCCENFNHLHMTEAI